ncbi:hypothetical protein CANCADRAFT_31192 [Tortispora caseinolytica NRRL Y-17796]|uniref:Uncharacterized protein n=1 Tax=Tortispora caseinolytica NRRL Y-17796 TaxID=767744 RepID=A0A1E4TEE7_9ASCO|nr:hypothetical protein CANCADRAFT_31192 [Tortispora caseinolytica NRRL Y-17796]
MNTPKAVAVKRKRGDDALKKLKFRREKRVRTDLSDRSVEVFRLAKTYDEGSGRQEG